MNKAIKHTLFAMMAFLIFAVSAEVLLRLSGKLRTYSELNFGEYQSPYDSNDVRTLFTWSPNDSIYIEQTEFTYSYLTNSYGFIDSKVLDELPRDSTAIYLGDSFVFGVGVDSKNNIASLLESQLASPFYNAGIPGSDPFFQIAIVDSIFAPLGFENYIFMLNFSDIYDYIFRGDENRFTKNGKIEYQKAPWYEKYYGKSYIVRLILHGLWGMDYSLLPKNRLTEKKKEAVEAYIDLLSKAAQEYNVLVLIQPYARQYANNNQTLTEVLNYKYLEDIHQGLLKKNIKSVDLNTSLSTSINNENYLEYSWELDGHYNAKGYNLLSNVVVNELTLNYPCFIKLEEACEH